MTAGLPLGKTRPAVDFSLMAQQRGPIAGAGSEVMGVLTGWSWCGYCGFTGRCAGPVQQSCPERHGWHAWLRQCVDLHETFSIWRAAAAPTDTTEEEKHDG